MALETDYFVKVKSASNNFFQWNSMVQSKEYRKRGSVFSPINTQQFPEVQHQILYNHQSYLKILTVTQQAEQHQFNIAAAIFGGEPVAASWHQLQLLVLSGKTQNGVHRWLAYTIRSCLPTCISNGCTVLLLNSTFDYVLHEDHRMSTQASAGTARLFC